MYKKLPKMVRQLIVLIIGVPIISLGVILLPLPGPGWLVILSGLYIISREFAWARKYIDIIEAKLRQLAAKIKDKQSELKEREKPDSGKPKNSR
ncbi:MAG TPA: PGPGW domain-containing protein [Candidatus Saccharimonadia bacterium]